MLNKLVGTQYQKQSLVSAKFIGNSLREGIKYAKQAGWDTVSKAIVGVLIHRQLILKLVKIHFTK